jgi:hypothetical protein
MQGFIFIWTNDSESGGISCQFLPPGGSVVPRYLLKLLFSEKSQNCKKTQQPLKLEKKFAQIWNA